MDGTPAALLAWQQYGNAEYRDRLVSSNNLRDPAFITPTTKAFDAGHDEELTEARILSENLLTEAQWSTVKAHALALFARGREIAARQGLILVDTKYEFGVDEAGEIILAGSFTRPMWVQAGDEVRADFGPMGVITCRFS